MVIQPKNEDWMVAILFLISLATKLAKKQSHAGQRYRIPGI